MTLSIDYLLDKVYRNYTYRIYPRIQNLRGTHRIWKLLKRLKTRKMDAPSEESTPIDAIDIEHDNLIILDACRYDIYNEIRDCTGYRISQGSATEGYVKHNFTEGDWSETVYVSANPQLSESRFRDHTGRSPSETFHVLYDIYNQGWDEKIATVPPKIVAENARSAAKLFPDKNIIIHFMQPHAPFTTSDKDIEYINKNFSMTEAKQAEKGEISRSEYREMYKKEMEHVLSIAEDLANDLKGKTVITGDHGELLGECGLYEHPAGFDIDVLKKVPLDVVE